VTVAVGNRKVQEVSCLKALKFVYVEECWVWNHCSTSSLSLEKLKYSYPLSDLFSLKSLKARLATSPSGKMTPQDSTQDDLKAQLISNKPRNTDYALIVLQLVKSVSRLGWIHSVVVVFLATISRCRTCQLEDGSFFIDVDQDYPSTSFNIFDTTYSHYSTTGRRIMVSNMPS